jgi:hypothetical protein
MVLLITGVGTLFYAAVVYRRPHHRRAQDRRENRGHDPRHPQQGTFDTTPSANDRLRAGDTIVVLGAREQVGRLERLMRGEEMADRIRR